MAELIVPHFAVGSGDEITIDGVVYKVPRVDSAGRLYVNVFATGASEVKTAYASLISTTTRATLVTPTAGKKIRVISVRFEFLGNTGQRAQVYFGTGADISTTAGKAIDEASNSATFGPAPPMIWPDGGGPVGAANDVLSIRCAFNLAEAVHFLIVYREE